MLYFESRLKVSVYNINEIRTILEFCKELGINNVILESKDENQNFNSDIKKNLNNLNIIKIYFRNNINSKNLSDFKKKISMVNNSKEIISVESLNKQVQIQAAKDSRVDIISYSDVNILKTISPGVISLTKQNNSFIEFSIAPIFIENKASQSKNLRYLYRGVQLVENLNANYIISGNFNELFDLRHPRGLISICNTLLGLSIQDAKKAFGYNIKSLIERVQNRSSEDFYEPGFQLIKKGGV